MNSRQYEELCRSYLGKLLGIPVEEIKSVRIPNLRRPGLPGSKSQIDLYCEISNEVCLYRTVANAKWRSKAKINEGEGHCLWRSESAHLREERYCH